MQRKIIGIDGAGKATTLTQDIAAPAAGELQIAVETSQVSLGTEMMWIPTRRKKPDPSLGIAYPGYSVAGRVIACGSGVGGYKNDDRVMAMGGDQASHASIVNVGQNLCCPLPDAISFEHGAYVALALTAMQAVRRLEPEFGRNYIVAGLGVVGQLAAQFLRIAGCGVIGLDILKFRLEIARRTGMPLGLTGFDEASRKAVFDFTGGDGVDGGILSFGGDGTQTLKDVYNLMITPPDTHRLGPIVVVGGCTFNNLMLAAALGNIDIRSSARTGPGYKDNAWEKGASYPAGLVRWDTNRQMRLFRRYAEQGLLQLEPLSTHRYSIDDAGRAYDEMCAGLPDSLGVFFEMGR